MSNVTVVRGLALGLVALSVVSALWLAPTLHGARWLAWAICGVTLLTAIVLMTQIPAVRAEEQDATGFVPLGQRVPAGTPRHIVDLAERLRTALGDAPYEVSVSPIGVQATWDSGLMTYNTMVGPHRWREVYRTTLIDCGNNRFRRTDQTGQTEASLREAIWAKSSGRSWSFERRVDVVPTPGGLQTPVDITYSSATLNRAIASALGAVGGRTVPDSGTRIAIIAGVMGVVLALLGMLVAIV